MLKLRDSICARVRTECAEQIRAFVLVTRAHQELLNDLTTRSLLPGMAKQVLDAISGEHLEDPTPERLEAHAKVLAALRAIAENPSVQNGAVRAANLKFSEGEAPLLALRQAIENSFDKQIDELRGRESTFFSEFGLDCEPTGVSRSAEQLKESTLSHSLFSSGKNQTTDPSYIYRFNVFGLEWLFQG